MSDEYIKWKGPDGRTTAFPKSMTQAEINDALTYELYPVESFFPEDHESAKSVRSYIDKVESPDLKQAVIQKYAKHYVAKEREGGHWAQDVNDHARMFARNLPLVGEYMDEARSAIRQLSNGEIGGDWEISQAIEAEKRRQLDADVKEGKNVYSVDIPFLGKVDTGDVAKGAGVAASLAVPLGAAARLGHVGSGAVSGAVMGAADASGAASGGLNRLSEGLTGGVIGGVTGAIVGRIAGKLSDKAGKVSKHDASARQMASNRLFHKAKEDYQKFDDIEVWIGNYSAPAGQVGKDVPPPTLYTEVLNRTSDLLEDAGKDLQDPSLAPIRHVYNILKRRASKDIVKLKDVQGTRSEMLKQLRKAKDPDVRHVLSQAVGEFEDVFDKARLMERAVAKRGDVPKGAGLTTNKRLIPSTRGAKASTPAEKLREVTGEVKEALDRANKNYKKGINVQIIESTIGKAERAAKKKGVGGNFDSDIRTGAERILNTPSLARRYSPETRDMLKGIVEGTFTRNMLRRVGKFAPDRSTLGAVGTAITTAGATAGAGPVGTVAALGGGATLSGIKRASDFTHKRAMQRIADLVGATKTIKNTDGGRAFNPARIARALKIKGRVIEDGKAIRKNPILNKLGDRLGAVNKAATTQLGKVGITPAPVPYKRWIRNSSDKQIRTANQFVSALLNSPEGQLLGPEAVAELIRLKEESERYLK